MRPTIMLLTDNFPPNIGPASFRMEALVRELSERGYNIEVITAHSNRYENLKAVINDNYGPNVRVNRVKNVKQLGGFIKKSYSYIEYFIKAFFLAKKELKNVDIIIATSPQILTGYLGALLKKRNIPLILDIRDLWPDAMIELYSTRTNSLIYKILKKIEIYMYKKATRIVINSPAYEEDIRRYVNKDIILITNGLDDYFYNFFYEITPQSPDPNKKIRVVYSGNLGIGQDIIILTKLNDEILNNFIFDLIGDGSQKEDIKKAIKKNNKKNIILHPPKSRKDLVEDYQNADAFFVHLKQIPMYKKTIPSKIFEYVATKKPVVYGLQGVAKDIMDELNGGYSFEPGNVKSLEAALIKMKNDLETGKWKYENNSILEEKYLRSQLSKKFADIVEETLNDYN
jgi:glycosyltransferase involved in cell wall biosynthesis